MAYYDDGENSFIKRYGNNPIIKNEGQLPYYEKRSEEYPDIGEQLDDLFKQGAFSEEMTARIQAVKDRYAKESADEHAARKSAYEEATAAAQAAEEARLAEEETQRLADKLRMEEEALAEWRAAHPGE
jgi:hypothetical protein